MTDAEIANLIAQRDALLTIARDGWRSAKLVAIHAGLASTEKAANRMLDKLDEIELEILQREERTL